MSEPIFTSSTFCEDCPLYRANARKYGSKCRCPGRDEPGFQPCANDKYGYYGKPFSEVVALENRRRFNDRTIALEDAIVSRHVRSAKASQTRSENAEINREISQLRSTIRKREEAISDMISRYQGGIIAEFISRGVSDIPEIPDPPRAIELRKINEADRSKLQDLIKERDARNRQRKK